MQEPGTLVLAFSGGLDTSYCVPRLAEAGWAVHTCYVDTGGATATEAEAIRAQASAVGAVRHHHVDARAPVYDRFIRFLIQANVLRGGVYPLSVAAERTQQALSVLEVARQVGAVAVAHGSTGAGNDQVRFDVALRVLAPDLEVVTPIREQRVRREDAIAYLEARGMPVPPKAGAYSINRGLWGTTWGGGWTHDSWAGPPAELAHHVERAGADGACRAENGDAALLQSVGSHDDVRDFLVIRPRLYRRKTPATSRRNAVKRRRRASCGTLGLTFSPGRP